MRTSAMVLGIIGGVIGLIVGIIFLAQGFSFLSWYVEPAEARRLTLLGFLVFIFAIVGIVGSSITKSKPVAAGVLMLVGGGGGFLSRWFWLLPGTLLLIGAILSLVSRKQTT